MVFRANLLLPAMFVVCFGLDCMIQQIPQLRESGVVISLMALVFLSFYRQGLMTLTLLFFMGFFYDALLGTVMGFTSLMWLSLHLLVVRNYSHFLNKSILDAWVGYAVVGCIWSTGHWLVHSFPYEGALGFYKPLVNTVLLSLLFPILYMRFDRGRL